MQRQEQPGQKQAAGGQAEGDVGVFAEIHLFTIPFTLDDTPM
jgi:hypothetical protein